jgi:hypothetical protein
MTDILIPKFPKVMLVVPKSHHDLDDQKNGGKQDQDVVGSGPHFVYGNQILIKKPLWTNLAGSDEGIKDELQQMEWMGGLVSKVWWCTCLRSSNAIVVVVVVVVIVAVAVVGTRDVVVGGCPLCADGLL